MSLNNPESRRGLRAVIQAIAALAFIGLLYWITYRVDAGSPVITDIVRGALMILGLGELLYGAENVTRAVKFKVGPGGVDTEIGGDV